MTTITRIEGLKRVPIGTKVYLDLTCRDSDLEEVEVKGVVMVKDATSLDVIPCEKKCIFSDMDGECCKKGICLYRHRKDKESVYFEEVK